MPTQKIKLNKGLFALVDDTDYPNLVLFKWHVAGRGYVIRNINKGQVGNTKMHRLIMRVPDGQGIDHINGNKLDNRKENLRVCTQSQNSANKTKQSNNTSGYKGVYWENWTNKWRAKIMFEGKNYPIGRFRTIREAVIAYNNMAIKIHKEFAKINQIN